MTVSPIALDHVLNHDTPSSTDTLTACDDVVIVVSNAPDALLAKRIAHILVEEGLAACVNLGPPGLSMYMWEGQLEGTEEIPLTMKTTATRAVALVARLKQLHPYQVPEVLVLPVTAGLASYLEWVRGASSSE
jgi:periplasmic divalent cation tolerance protein